MTSDDVNSVTEKKSVIFEEKKKQKEIGLIRRGEPVGPKQTLVLTQHFNLSDSNVSGLDCNFGR